MNEARRKLISQAVSQLEAAGAIIQQAAEEEREAYDNLSEGLQASERGEKLDETATQLEEAQQSIEEAVEKLGEIEL